MGKKIKMLYIFLKKKPLPLLGKVSFCIPTKKKRLIREGEKERGFFLVVGNVSFNYKLFCNLIFLFNPPRPPGGEINCYVVTHTPF